MQVVLTVYGVEIQKDAGRFTDACKSILSMGIPVKGEAGDRFQLGQIRAGDLKKISDHQVRTPVLLQFSKAVKQIECVLSFRSDNLIDITGKSFKSLTNIYGIHFKVGAVFHQHRFIQQGRMAAKVYIKNPFAVCSSLSDKRAGSKSIGLQRVDLPDDMITGAEAVDYFICPRKSGTYLFKNFHCFPPFPHGQPIICPVYHK